MPQPLVVSIPHHLGKEEAMRRLQSGLGKVRANYGHLFAVQEETWTDNHLQFRVSALGQTVSGTLDVLDEQVNLVVHLPWLLAKLANAIQPLVRKEGTLLLEKK
ncbi:MAG TPA: polyhydroxyalkanoic acid system family protein [Xanthobacteraceae bacterium]|nr:polyhydroxyalkanoic acid system family protein [Xanthobacteraceae bacterium]